MRDPDRIETMLSLLGRVWDVIPDQRLGQLIVNLARSEDGSIRDPWEVEDDELLKKMGEICMHNNLGGI